MTAFDRIEPRLPELMAELAPMSVPDYFDDMLRQTGRTRQRPAWASLERWLPMDVVARPVSFRGPALRPPLILLMVGLLIAAGLALYAGSHRTRLPEPFGPARNGAIVISTSNGDIAGVDPVTGALTTLIGGPTTDVAPLFARDGQHFVFAREMNGVAAYWIADADGSNARELAPSSVHWLEWSSSGDRIVLTRLEGAPATSIVNVANGAVVELNPRVGIQDPFWRPNRDQIVFSNPRPEGHVAYYVVNADGTGLREIDGVSPDSILNPVLAPDGSRIAYTTWAEGPGLQGRVHVVDIDTGVDQPLLFEGSEGTNEFPYAFSPDGSKLLLERHAGEPSYEVNGEFGYRLVVAPADGVGPAIPIGPAMPSGTEGATAEFSPDGTQVLAFYKHDQSTWLLEADGSGGEQVDWNPQGEFNWQRLAP
jgi:hypothetical protein